MFRIITFHGYQSCSSIYYVTTNITLVNNRLRKWTETVKCDERFVLVVKIGDSLLINVYFPCQGTADRLAVCDDMLCEIAGLCERFPACQYIIAGDFNCDQGSNDVVASNPQRSRRLGLR